jgi:hypothetical protein
MEKLMEQLAELCPILAVVVVFVWYLQRRDILSRDATNRGHEVVEKLAEALSDNTVALINLSAYLSSQESKDG